MSNMKQLLVYAALPLVCGMVFACASAPADSPSTAPQPAASVPAADFSAVSGKEWKLSKLTAGGKVTAIDRRKFAADGFDGLFSIQFADQVSGQAAPNRYSGPYQAGDGGAMTIGMMRSTMMASVYNTGELTEQDYFRYLSSVKSWALTGEGLELRGSDANGTEFILLFVL